MKLYKDCIHFNPVIFAFCSLMASHFFPSQTEDTHAKNWWKGRHEKERRIWHEEGGRKNKTLTAYNRGHQKSKALQLRIIEGTGVHGSDEPAGQGWPQPLLPWGCKKCHTPQIRRRGCRSFQWKRKTTHEENYFRCVHNDASHSGLKIWHHRQMWHQVHASVCNDCECTVGFQACLLVLWGVRPRTPMKFFHPTSCGSIMIWFILHFKIGAQHYPPHLSEIDSRVFVLFGFLFSTSDRSNNPVVKSFWLLGKFQVLQALQTTSGGLGEAFLSSTGKWGYGTLMVDQMGETVCSSLFLVGGFKHF